MRKFSQLLVVMLLLLFWHTPADACFGAKVRVGVPHDRAGSLAAYSVGYFIEEKTGIGPEFVEADDLYEALLKNELDVLIEPGGAGLRKEAETREAGSIPGIGGSRFVLRREMLDDLRFSTVEKALNMMPAFFGSGAYGEAAGSAVDARKAARKAVADGT